MRATAEKSVDGQLTPPELARRVWAGYFAAQAVAGTGFWVVLAASPTARSWFEMMRAQHSVTNSFFFADVLMGIIGSALTALAVSRRSAAAVPLAGFTAGGLVYATLYLVGWVSFTGVGGGLLALMLVPSTLSSWVAYQVWSGSR